MPGVPLTIPAQQCTAPSLGLWALVCAAWDRRYGQVTKIHLHIIIDKPLLVLLLAISMPTDLQMGSQGSSMGIG